ncbi:hypothetical protein QCA50_015837 [Cerrena zonata]|uniref:DNA replication complex GINS protein PSF1 n=1 Tax=Cerrena zonata TaxID=2478898 RepID=A0AAW0FUJ4_9APHY
MYGDLSNKLILDAKRSSNLSELPLYQTDLIKDILKEIHDLDRDIEYLQEQESIQNSSSSSEEEIKINQCQIFVTHLCLRRNKRCLLAYQYLRASKIDEFCWLNIDPISNLDSNSKFKSSTSQNLNLDNLSHNELEYFKNYQDLLIDYKSNFPDIDLSGDLEPPTNIFVDVRVLKDGGEVQTEYGVFNLIKDSQFYVRKSDVERLIQQEELALLGYQHYFPISGTLTISSTYPLPKFNKVSQLVNSENEKHQLNCTEFEILTATAFKIFQIEKIEFAIIEVGLGGRLDATNVLTPLNGNGVVATGITKIGFDHEGFLGNTLAAIAGEKAGIIKEQVPVVIDSTNHQEALNVIEKKAHDLNANLYYTDKSLQLDSLLKKSPLKGDYQYQNLGIALKIIDLIKSRFHLPIPSKSIDLGISKTNWPGRLQSVEIPNKDLTVLIDGAHNESAAIELGKYLANLRVANPGIILVVALTKGKSIENLLKHISDKDNDTLIATGFSTPDNMPWVSSFPIDELQQRAQSYINDIRLVEPDLDSIFNYICQLRKDGDNREVVICGSLYLCSDVLRYVN